MVNATSQQNKDEVDDGKVFVVGDQNKRQETKKCGILYDEIKLWNSIVESSDE